MVTYRCQSGGSVPGGGSLLLVFLTPVQRFGLCGVYGVSPEHEGGDLMTVKTTHFDIKLKTTWPEGKGRHPPAERTFSPSPTYNGHLLGRPLATFVSVNF